MKKTAWFAAVAAALTLSACGGGGGGGSGAGGSAVFLKDAPIVTSDSRPADEVNIEILKVELKSRDSRDRHVTVFEAAPGSGIPLNVLSLTFPVLLSLAQVPEGSYDEVELKFNPNTATIHFSDNNTTLPLVVTESGEGDEAAEFEFEFEPPFTVEAGTVSNAVVDFAPVVTFDGANYVLGHDHEHDDTGEVEDVDGDNEDGPDHHGAEVEGIYQSVSGDVITVSKHGAPFQIDISAATRFELNGVSTDKAGFLGSLSANEEIEAEGVFADGVLHAEAVKNQGVDD